MIESVVKLANEDETFMKEWMRKYEEDRIAQQKQAKKQMIFMGATAAFSAATLLVLLVWTAVLVPQIVSTAKAATECVEVVTDATKDLEQVITNLQAVSGDLAKTDLVKMIEDVSGLVEDSQAAVTQAMDKVESMDIESMNKAIQDLGTIIAPLAKLLGGTR